MRASNPEVERTIINILSLQHGIRFTDLALECLRMLGPHKLSKRTYLDCLDHLIDTNQITQFKFTSPTLIAYIYFPVNTKISHDTYAKHSQELREREEEKEKEIQGTKIRTPE